MDKQEMFNVVVAEFRKADMNVVRLRSPGQFNAVAPNGAEYIVNVQYRDRDPLHDAPRWVSVSVTQGPHRIHEGKWRSAQDAATAARAALATIRNTGYVVQGELL